MRPETIDRIRKIMMRLRLWKADWPRKGTRKVTAIWGTRWLLNMLIQQQADDICHHKDCPMNHHNKTVLAFGGCNCEFLKKQE